jgi:iron complex transport system ATP-binding protein
VTAALFEIDRLSFAYESRRVLAQVTLAIAEASFTGIVGPNGSGKTTLLELLGGLRRPAEGRIRLKGRELASYPRRELARRLALVPQDFYINFPFSVQEVVAMGRAPHIPRFGRPGRKDRERVWAAMAAAGVAEFAERFVTELSGGERQRVVFARALAQDTPVLLLDEATSNLDIGQALRLLSIAGRSVRREGRTVVAVFQDINQAAACCDRLIVLSNGRVAACGATDEVLTPATIRAVFGVESRVVRDDFAGGMQVVFRRGAAHLPGEAGHAA